jgi:RNA recognition motif-containing protein
MSLEDSPVGQSQADIKPQDDFPSPEEIKKTKIWAGGIPPRTSKEKLKNAFIKGFSITAEESSDITVMIKLGYGFISLPDTLMSRIDCELQSASVYIESKRLDLAVAMKRKDARTKIEDERNRKLYVGGLPLDTTKAELKDHFSEFGQLDYANVVYSIGSTLPRGFGFVKFKSESDADDALEFENHFIRGFGLNLKRSKTKREIDINKKIPDEFEPDINKKSSNKIEPSKIISEKESSILELVQESGEKLKNQTAELNQINSDEKKPEIAEAQGPKSECPKSGRSETARPPQQPQTSSNEV